jgi:hypothetical protein
MIAFNTSDSSCTSLGGINVNLSNYYMLHVWVLDDMKFLPDVYAGQIPCITGGGAIHDDPDNPCHFSRTGSASASTGGKLTARLASAPIAGGSSAGPGFVCHLGEGAATAS